jgi:hypothetical protein
LQKQQYEEAAASEREAWQLQRRQKAAAKAAKHQGMAYDVVWQLVQLAERMVAYRTATGGQPVPRKDWREWLTMFATGKNPGGQNTKNLPLLLFADNFPCRPA